ncbi:M23 family metallopeptidase [Synechococcus sp. PCC 6312]|uniref:M23 family metallopeptidase n=1 Tax=Synechococcus sp. (strain ATCC 27167 / PCC 6312) TaxID=195253 RepID=UPI00029EC6E1|nr:metalloendopeptidase-like membrane protein [Synechococcus sp. PCC 6312]
MAKIGGFRVRVRPLSLGLMVVGLLMLMLVKPGLLLPSVAQDLTGLGWELGSFPVENFQTYSSPFGYRASPTGGYGTEFHNGLDFAAPEGSYIRNWWAGKVIEVSDDTACGTLVRVQSGAWQHVYCHMKGQVEIEPRGRVMVDRAGGVEIWQGQTLATGMRIGRVGMTGRTTGPHLHWTLRHQGQLVNPGVVLQAMAEAQQAVTAPESSVANRG